MSWRDNSNQLIPVNQGINMRNAAFTLLVLAISLLSISSLLAANTPPIAPKPTGTIEMSKAGNQTIIDTNQIILSGGGSYDTPPL